MHVSNSYNVIKIDWCCILNSIMDAPNASGRDGKRGPTQLEKLVKDRAKGASRITVLFNARGQVIGPAQFQSFLGSLARAHIPITIADWSGVSDKLKQQLWQTAFVSQVI